MEYQEEFYNKLKDDKIKINWNKNPIRMSLFLSFLTVPCVRSTDHLGIDNGWTKLVNEDLKLIIGGGVVSNVEYLDYLKYGKNLSNRYNDFVNPFYIFDILNNEGKLFFIAYYKEEINEVINKLHRNVESAKLELQKSQEIYMGVKDEYSKLLNPLPSTKH